MKSNGKNLTAYRTTVVAEDKVAPTVSGVAYNQSEDKIEFSLTPEISSKINGEKLFLQLYNISPKFKLRYQLKRITFTLPVKNLEKHYLYYLVDLLLLIIEEVE